MSKDKNWISKGKWITDEEFSDYGEMIEKTKKTIEETNLILEEGRKLLSDLREEEIELESTDTLKEMENSLDSFDEAYEDSLAYWQELRRHFMEFYEKVKDNVSWEPTEEDR